MTRMICESVGVLFLQKKCDCSVRVDGGWGHGDKTGGVDLI